MSRCLIFMEQPSWWHKAFPAALKIPGNPGGKELSVRNPGYVGKMMLRFPLSRTARYSKRSSLHITHDSPKYPDVSMRFPRYIHQHPLETLPWYGFFVPKAWKDNHELATVEDEPNGTSWPRWFIKDDSRNLMDFHLSCDEPGNVSDAGFHIPVKRLLRILSRRKNQQHLPGFFPDEAWKIKRNIR